MTLTEQWRRDGLPLYRTTFWYPSDRAPSHPVEAVVEILCEAARPSPQLVGVEWWFNVTSANATPRWLLPCHFDRADLDAAVNAVAFGSFANTGQICMSTERIVVDVKIADDFVARFVKKAMALPLGDPRKPEPVVLGSVIGMGTVEPCNALIDDALAKGAKLLCGGEAGIAEFTELRWITVQTGAPLSVLTA